MLKLAPSPKSRWYGRRRIIVSLALLCMTMLGLLAQSGLAEGTIQHLGTSLTNIISSADSPLSLQAAAHGLPQKTLAPLQPPVDPQQPVGNTRVVRIDSAARNQYASDYQWRTWAYSSCSGIAMETVMNYYGRHLIASDVLQVEQNLGVWNVQLGLLRDDGIALTAQQFGFTTSASHSLTVDQVVALANQGTPVIVSVRDSYYFPGGHLFVIYGGDSQYVFSADSSPQNLPRLTRGQFAAMWQGFSAVLTPAA